LGRRPVGVAPPRVHRERRYSVYYATDNTGSGAGGFLPILMIMLLFGVMYFMMIRPQQKRRREAEQMQASLAPGDEVVTIGGLYGTVTGVDDETVTLEVAPGEIGRAHV